MAAKKILIIDDEPDVVKYLSVVLSDNGYQAFTAESVDEAMDVLIQVKPDLISLDVMMPKKSGISFYQQLKEDSRYKDIPVVILSGIRGETEFDIREFIQDESIPEPAAYIEKPIDVNKFMELIGGLIA